MKKEKLIIPVPFPFLKFCGKTSHGYVVFFPHFRGILLEKQYFLKSESVLPSATQHSCLTHLFSLTLNEK